MYPRKQNYSKLFPKKQNCSALFTPEEDAKMAYFLDRPFRQFVYSFDEWMKMMGKADAVSLADLHRHYKAEGENASFEMIAAGF